MTWDAKKQRNLARTAMVESKGEASGSSTSVGAAAPPAPVEPSATKPPTPHMAPPGGKPRGPR